MIVELPDLSDLRSDWSARVPEPDDIEALADLVTAHKVLVHGKGSADRAALESTVLGIGSWTRRQVVLFDPEGRLAAWAWVHDRAAGRTMLDVIVHPDHPEQDAVAELLYAWVERTAADIAELRGLTETQLDVMSYADDERQRTWMAKAGYEHTRTWLQMSRPVPPDEPAPKPRDGVLVRPVSQHENGVPVAGDLQIVHLMLEESFADHFNSYRESFPEFVQRLREDPGHRWDHWWIAEVLVDDELVPGGAVVSSVLPPDDSGAHGSYIDYIGVHRDARGRGVAKALLETVLHDTAQRGRNRVGLECDEDSPTGADQMYLAMGWETYHRTESWHATARVSPSD